MNGPLVQSIGWALLHFLWQGALVAGLLAVALKWLPARAATLRYGLACGALALLALTPAATALWIYSDLAPSVAIEVLRPLQLDPRTVAEVASAVSTAEWKLTAERAVVAPLLEAVAARAHWLVLAWALGVMLGASRVLAGWRRVVRLTGSCAPAPLEWQGVLNRLAAAVGVQQPVRLLAGEAVPVPSAVGWLAPVILMPVSVLAGLPAQQIELILAHELAHIRRHDYLVNLLQTAVETVLFYHPAVWWIGSVIRAERENCCDDAAVATGATPLSYARALTALETLRVLPSPAMSALGGSLPDRVRRLVFAQSRCVSRWTAGVSAMTLAAGLALAIPLVALAVPVGADVEHDGGDAFELRRELMAAPPAPRRAPRAPAALAALPSPVAPPVPSVPRAAAEPARPATPSVPSTPGAAAEPARPAAPASPAPPATPGAPAWPAEAGAPAAPSTPAAPAAEASPAVPGAPAPIAMPRARAIPAPAAAPAAPAPVAVLALAPEAIDHADHDEDEADERDARTLVGRDELTVDQLVNLRNAGIGAEQVQAYRRMGFAPTVSNLISLGHAGVTADYAAAMRERFGKDLPVDAIVSMRHVGVTPEFVRSLEAMGFRNLDVDQVTGARAVGVTEEYLRGLAKADLRITDLEQLTGLRAVGVDSKYVIELRSLQLGPLDLDTLQSLRALGVTAEWVRSLEEVGLKVKDLEVLSGLRAQGVDAEYVRRMRAAGLKGLTPDKLIALKASGVTPEYLAGLRGD